MKKPGFRFTAALACSALPLLAVAADQVTGQPLPTYVYRPTAPDNTNRPPPGTPYASTEAEKASGESPIQMAPVSVYAPVNTTDIDVKDILAQHDRMESHALIKQDLPNNKRLELILPPEPALSWGGRSSVFGESAHVALASWRW
jgi:hypothetical protein